MNRREFLCLMVGMTSGLMIEPPRSVVRIPTRPRIGPLPAPTPLSPKQLAYLDNLSCPPIQLVRFRLSKIDWVHPDGTREDLGLYMIRRKGRVDVEHIEG